MIKTSIYLLEREGISNRKFKIYMEHLYSVKFEKPVDSTSMYVCVYESERKTLSNI